MKKLITSSILICMLITSCQRSKNSKVISDIKQVSKIDTYMPSSKDRTFRFRSNEFKYFFEKFISDSIYQMVHVKFPLKGSYSDYDKDVEWTKDNWTCLHSDLQQVIKENKDSISIKQDTASFFFGVYCLDCGFSFEMEFNKLENDWYLTHRQENNY